VITDGTTDAKNASGDGPLVCKKAIVRIPIMFDNYCHITSGTNSWTLCSHIHNEGPLISDINIPPNRGTPLEGPPLPCREHGTQEFPSGKANNTTGMKKWEKQAYLAKSRHTQQRARQIAYHNNQHYKDFKTRATTPYPAFKTGDKGWARVMDKRIPNPKLAPSWERAIYYSIPGIQRHCIKDQSLREEERETTKCQHSATDEASHTTPLPPKRPGNCTVRRPRSGPRQLLPPRGSCCKFSTNPSIEKSTSEEEEFARSP
jgi:hypothetical protein